MVPRPASKLTKGKSKMGILINGLLADIETRRPKLERRDDDSWKTEETTYQVYVPENSALADTGIDLLRQQYQVEIRTLGSEAGFGLVRGTPISVKGEAQQVRKFTHRLFESAECVK